MNYKRKCGFCGGDNYNEIYFGDWILDGNKSHFSIIKCQSCGLIRSFPVPKKTESTKEDISHRFNLVSNWENFGKEILRIIYTFKGKEKIRLLDIGCNIGIFVNLTQKQGINSIGIDTDEYAIQLGRHKFKNIDIRNTTLGKAKFRENSFDVITLTHTLEHVFEPKELLNEIYRLISKKGILIIEVPNIDGLPVIVQKIRKDVWYGYDPIHHVWHFTAKSITKMLNSCNFEILVIDSSSNLYYEKTNSVRDLPRSFILRISKILGKADQIRVVAKPNK